MARNTKRLSLILGTMAKNKLPKDEEAEKGIELYDKMLKSYTAQQKRYDKIGLFNISNWDNLYER